MQVWIKRPPSLPIRAGVNGLRVVARTVPELRGTERSIGMSHGSVACARGYGQRVIFPVVNWVLAD